MCNFFWLTENLELLYEMISKFKQDQSGSAIVLKQNTTNLSDKLHEMLIREGLRLLLQRITHEDGITGQETKSTYSYGFNHFISSN